MRDHAIDLSEATWSGPGWHGCGEKKVSKQIQVASSLAQEKVWQEYIEVQGTLQQFLT